MNQNRSADLLTIFDLNHSMSEVKSWWEDLGIELQLDLEEIEE